MEVELRHVGARGSGRVNTQQVVTHFFVGSSRRMDTFGNQNLKGLRTQAAASEFQLAWAEQLPFLPIMNQFATFVNNKKVHGWQPFVWNLYPYYNDTWIEA